MAGAPRKADAVLTHFAAGQRPLDGVVTRPSLFPRDGRRLAISPALTPAGLGVLGYPASFLGVVTGQLLGLQIGELLWLVRGGQLVFCLCLDNHLRRERWPRRSLKREGWVGAGPGVAFPAVMWVLTICQDCLVAGPHWLPAEANGRWMPRACWATAALGPVPTTRGTP